MPLNLTESHIWLNFAEKNRPLSGKCSRGISDIMLWFYVCYLWLHALPSLLHRSPHSIPYGLWGRERIAAKSSGLIFMYPPVTTAEQISVGNLERYVEENYSEKSQKLYLAVLKSIRVYGGGYLTPSEIDGKYIAGFRTHLSDRLSPGSISQYLRSLRSLLNSYLGPEYRPAIKEALSLIHIWRCRRS